MVMITVVGILAAFALLASYYAFVTKCHLLRALHPRWPGVGGREAASSSSVVVRAASGGDHRRGGGGGLGLPLIRMLPVVKFTAAAAACDGGGTAPRISVSECAVCLSEFAERERVRLLPNCSHAFHIDCIDTWLQGSARCPFCRSDVTLPSCAAPSARRRDDALASSGGDDSSSSIVVEVRGERERWFSQHHHHHHGATVAGRHPDTKPPEWLGDEAIDTRRRKREHHQDDAFAAVQQQQQPLRRSLSLDSCCDKHLYVSVQELLAKQRQVAAAHS